MVENYILITRNPRNKKLLAITADDGETVAEFESESDAIAAADHTTVCKAWGYEVIEIGL